MPAVPPPARSQLLYVLRGQIALGAGLEVRGELRGVYGHAASKGKYKENEQEQEFTRACGASLQGDGWINIPSTSQNLSQQ